MAEVTLKALVHNLVKGSGIDLTASLTASPGDAVSHLETLCDKRVMTANTVEAP